MKIRTQFSKENGIFVLPVIGIAYGHEDRELAFIFMFAYWAFSIEIDFK